MTLSAHSCHLLKLLIFVRNLRGILPSFRVTKLLGTLSFFLLSTVGPWVYGRTVHPDRWFKVGPSTKQNKFSSRWHLTVGP